MQSVILFFVVIGVALASPVNSPKEFASAVGPIEESVPSVTYYFYDQACVDDENDFLRCQQAKDLVPTTFDSKKKVLFLIHGWLNKYNSDSINLISAAILKTHDINIIVVDWSPLADGLYLAAKNGVPDIGKSLGTFVQNLTSTYNIPLSDVAMVGHSLGAHIAGIAGNILNGQLDHIVGLDPASPFVDDSDMDYILDFTDAKFVQIIHTSSGKLSLMKSTGHADYFPNGGTEQVGCLLDVFGDCAHKRSYKYFAESISNKFFAQACANYKEYEEGACTGNVSFMGGYDVDREASGNYYLQTHEKSPFSEDAK